MIKNKGTRSVKKPKLATIGFFLATCSVKLAENNWGKNHELPAIMATIPMGKVLVVSLLMKRGTIVEAEMRLAPNPNAAVSKVVAVKFQR